MSSKRIAVFLSMSDEVCTKEIIKDVFKCGKSCFIPRYESGSSHMDMLKLSSLQDMETLPLTSWNIRQPADDDNSREEALAAGKQSIHKHHMYICGDTVVTIKVRFLSIRSYCKLISYKVVVIIN